MPILETELHTNSATSTSETGEPCPFVWYELHTPDATAAAAFYQPVLGWTTQDASAANRNYTLICVRDTPIGGLLHKPPAAFSSGQKARWVGYIGVPDARLFSQRVEQAGGTVHKAAEEIPGVGTFAVAADPQGAIFTLFQPPTGMTRPERPGTSTPGMAVWHELAAADWQSSFAFYSDLFGWTKAHVIEMGPGGVYQIFAAGAELAGGMMTVPHPGGWLFYFHVAEIQAAIDRVKQNGGTLVNGPCEVPGGQLTALCLDPQGAIFGMVGPGRQ
jgi:predicted enzyme related to lactoylglutathione lyase